MRTYLLTTFNFEKVVGFVCLILLVWCCFNGYRMRRFFGVVVSFIGCFSVGGWLIFKVVQNPFICYPVAIVCGLPFAYLAMRFKKFGSFMLTAVLCCLTISVFFTNLNIIQEVIVVAVAGGFGLLTFVFEKAVTIIATAVNCGMMIVGIFLFLIGYPAQALYIALGAIISLAGVVFQFNLRQQAEQ